ncbi:hypothetical protein [Kribbella albertanoniae]|uniref:Uncharacterized protein n=1 Tax=Kribbella albertanoniae TaxID=1266829 RepID=A0A4R4PM68_9ACTN|nr:hypothetical protein [Kribbella albertanoniae]TDC23186.1 hypothetical protein E1261_29000 [Kribbella albertanoniae]
MDKLLPIFIALIPTVGVLWGARIASRDFQLRRELETARQFGAMVLIAHGRPTDGRDVGVTEQVAYIHLLGALGRRHKWLKPAARAALEDFSKWDAHDSASKIHRQIAAAGLAALKDLNAPARWWQSN